MLGRLSALSGLAFVACFASAAALYGSGAGSHPAEIAAYYAVRANRMRQIAGFAVLLAGCVLLLVYVGRLCRSTHAGHAVLGSGIAATGLLALANALWASSAFTVETEPGYRIAPNTHLLLEDAGFLTLVSAAALAIPFVAGITLRTFRGEDLPRWFAWLGGVAVLGLATAYWYVPLAAFLAWIGCGSVLLALQDSSR